MSATLTRIELASEGFSGDDQAGGEHRQRVYIAEYSEAVVDPSIPKSEDAIPQRGEDWSPDSPVGLVVLRRDAEPEPESFGRLWRITIDYEPSGGIGGKDKKDANGKKPSDKVYEFDPLQAPIAFTFEASEEQEDYYQDTNGDRSENSAKEPMDPLPKRRKALKSIVATVNLNEFDHEMYEAWELTVNRNPVKIDGHMYGAETMLLAPVSSEKTRAVREDVQPPIEVVFYKTQFRIYRRKRPNEFPPPWNETVNDFGWSELVATTRKKITHDDHTEITRPWPLNGSGGKRASASDPAATFTRHPYSISDWDKLPFVGVR